MTPSLGASLRAAREAKGCSLDDVERLTRLRAKFLAALEADDFAALPSEAQARGFLRNYAAFLELDVARVMALYDDARHKKPLRVRTAARPQAVTPAAYAPTARPHWHWPDVLFAIGVTATLALLIVWAIPQITPSAATAVAPTRAFDVTAAPTATPTPAPILPTATLPLPTPRAQYVGVNLSLRAELSVWVSVKVDGAEQFAGPLRAGDLRDFVGQSSVEVSTGNGLGTRIVWNGHDQGVMGQLGEAVIRLWTLDGMITPTPTSLPTPTATP